MKELEIKKLEIKKLPVVALRGLVMFPNVSLHFDAGRNISIAALESAMLEEDSLCVVATQKDIRQEDVGIEDLHSIGTLSRIVQLIKLPGNALGVVAEGIDRAKILSQVENEEYLEAEVAILPDENAPEGENGEAWERALIHGYEQFAKISSIGSSDMILSVLSEGRVSNLSDIMASNIVQKLSDKQTLLEILDVEARASKLLEILNKETEIKQLENSIQQKVRKSIEKGQKEYYLREQIKVIRDELGDGEKPEAEREDLQKRLDALDINDEIKEKIEKEIKRLGSLPMGSHEVPVIRTWIDWALDLPWNKYTEDDFNLMHAKKILDEDHYALDEVKDRIVEQLAVCNLRGDVQGTILCLSGPPGVGKTSVAASIARALGRNFVRMSLGGVHDESEIRGHRKTYIGAMPGRIISAMKEAGSMNPLILLDEVDKIGSDYRGDPSAALLEVLDSAQNNTFRDHYMEFPFDLSNVMFITTANNISSISPPLRDRMEIIQLSSYTEEEKVEIAKRHLLEKQTVKQGMPVGTIKISDSIMLDIVLGYTKEAGVRNLERTLAKICRKSATIYIEDRDKSIRINKNKLGEFLGPPIFLRSEIDLRPRIGVVTGLAWTNMGGETLEIEVVNLNGTGKLELTGQMGDVMKESAKAGYTYIRKHAEELGIDPEFYKKADIHIHIPEGAIPKDGPSAGISMTTAMVSALNGIAIKGEIAMTGEVTLRGKVLPIGGIKEKGIAAHRDGKKVLLFPAANKAEAKKELPEKIQNECKIIYVEELDEVIKIALVSDPVLWQEPEKLDIDISLAEISSDKGVFAQN